MSSLLGAGRGSQHPFVGLCAKLLTSYMRLVWRQIYLNVVSDLADAKEGPWGQLQKGLQIGEFDALCHSDGTGMFKQFSIHWIELLVDFWPVKEKEP